MNRGDVYEAFLDPARGSEQAGQRPVVVVSRDSLNEFLDTVIVVPFSTAWPGRPLYPNQALVYAPEGGLGVDSIALCEQIRAISRQRLVRKRGAIGPETMQRIDEAIRITIALD